MVATASRPSASPSTTRKRATPVAAAVDPDVPETPQAPEPEPEPAVVPIVSVDAGSTETIASPPALTPPAPELPPTPQPEPLDTTAEPSAPPAPPTYAVDIRLQASSFAGESMFHVRWTEQEVWDYLNDKLTKLRIPAKDVFGRVQPHIFRYVSLSVMVSEVLIYNWPYGESPSVGDSL